VTDCLEGVDRPAPIPAYHRELLPSSTLSPPIARLLSELDCESGDRFWVLASAAVRICLCKRDQGPRSTGIVSGAREDPLRILQMAHSLTRKPELIQRHARLKMQMRGDGRRVPIN